MENGRGITIKIILSDDEFRAMGISEEQLNSEVKSRIESGNIGEISPKVEEVILVVTPNPRTRNW